MCRCHGAGHGVRIHSGLLPEEKFSCVYQTRLGVLHHDIEQVNDVTDREWHPDKQIALERNRSYLEKDTIVSESLREIFLVEGYNLLETRNA
jgi:hypothetical protein